jgi:membrane protein
LIGVRSRGLLRAAAEIARTTMRNAGKHDLAGESAKVAYFFFVSLFPTVLILFALTGIIGGDAAFDRIAAVAQTAVPSFAWEFVQELIREVTNQQRPGLLSIGILLTFWAASSGLASLMHALNTIYDARETRGYWKRSAISLGILTAGLLLLVLAAAAFVFGLDWLRAVGLERVWRVARWPITFLLVTATMWLAYRYLPGRERRGGRVETIAGALAATFLWGISTSLFGLYVSNFGWYSRMYGALGAVIVLLIWFYIAAFSALLGGELAATLESRARKGAASTKTQGA